MQFCTQCGSKNDEDAKFCNNCGKDIEPQEQIKADKKDKRTAVWIIAVVSLLALSVAGTVWNWKSVPKIDIADSDADKNAGKEKPSAESTGEENLTATDVLKEAGKVFETVLGSDQEVGTIEKPIPLSNGLGDVENADSYNYTYTDCNTLYSDIFQQGAYAIERELLEATKISADEENRVGKTVSENIEKQFEGNLDVNNAWLGYVRKLGSHIVSRIDRQGINYQFHVIQDDMINAFAVPGGGIYIFTGLLDKIENEAQLAGIIAHEAKHVDLRHCIALYQVLSRLPEAAQNPITFTAAQVIKHPYSSRQEADADRKGLELAYSLSYSPYQIVKYWENETGEKGNAHQKGKGLIEEAFRVGGQVIKEAENMLSTHPDPQKRACLLRNHILKLQEKYPMDRFYVGEWNYGNKSPMFVTQK